MPTAVYDLPDPLDDRRATASPSPDDLLSQMADDAIDKLIAEADASVGPRAALLPTNDFDILPETPSHLTADSHDAPILSDTSVAEPSEHPKAGGEALESPSPSLQSVLAAAEATPATPATYEPPAALNDTATAQHAPITHADRPLSIATPPAGVSEISTADVKALLADEARAPGERSSILMLPLEMLSAPLTHADDGIRNAVGQIAIVTLLNAIAVLVYVFVVRHR